MRAALLFAALAVAVPDRPNPTPKVEPAAPEPQLGEWRLDKFDVGGGPGPALTDNSARILHFTRTEVLVSVNGQPQPNDSTTYTIDWSKKPAAIDIFGKMNGNMKKMEGIVKVEGDQLTMCLNLDGSRPTDFVSAPGKLTAVMYLKRVKK